MQNFSRKDKLVPVSRTQLRPWTSNPSVGKGQVAVGFEASQTFAGLLSYHDVLLEQLSDLQDFMKEIITQNEKQNK